MSTLARPLGLFDGARSPGQVAAPAHPLAPGRTGRLTASAGRRRAWWSAAVLLVGLLGVCLASMHLGQYPIPVADVVTGLARSLGLSDAPALASDGVLWNVRVPRIGAGVLVGAALGTAGAVTQSLFGNPLAEPSVIGITSGAGVGAAAATVLATAGSAVLLVPLGAFAAGVVTTLLVWGLAVLVRGGGTLTLVLVGIAVNAVAGAASSLMIFLTDTASREAVVFWQLGSLNGATWPAVGYTAPLVLAGLIWSLTMSGRLDVLVLGERAAAHTGVNLRSLRAQAVLCAALLTAAAVSVAGIIGFIGLIVPHLLRLVVGPRQQYILPLSALGGALLITGSDLVARTAIEFVDLPIGALTAVIGGPVFFLLLRRRGSVT